MTWIQALANPTDLLFPEVASGSTDQRDQIFGKRMLTVRQALKIADHSEDLYALRKTLSSALWKGGVSTDDRQMIIGHVSDTIIGKHYTEADMPTLKALLDRADHGVVVEHSAAHRFPVIRDCTVASGTPARAEIVLDDAGDLGAIRVINEMDGACLLAIKLKEATIEAPPWPGLQVLTRKTAPEAVADLLSAYIIVPPVHEAARRAYEHLLVTVSSSSDAKMVKSDE